MKKPATFEQRTEHARSAKQKRRTAIINHLRAAAPHGLPLKLLCTRLVIDGIACTDKALAQTLEHMSKQGVVQCPGRGVHARWMLTPLVVQPKPAVEGVKIALPRSSGSMPEPQIIITPQGVRITRQAAPPDRFACTLPKSGGQITQDWRERRLLEAQQ